MRHANRTHRRSPARFLIWAGLLAVSTTLLTVFARWVWAHPHVAWWVLLVVLVPATWWGNQWSLRKEREHARDQR